MSTVQKKDFTIDWICSFISGPKTLPFSDNGVHSTLPVFQAKNPGVISQLFSFLHRSHTEYAAKSVGPCCFSQSPLLELWVNYSSSFLPGFLLQSLVHSFYSPHRTEWSQWNLSWIMSSLCLETSKYPCNLVPSKAKVIGMACQILHLLTCPLPPLLHCKFVPKFVCILLLNGSNGRESACNAGGLGSVPESGRSPGEENGYPFQYSCRENLRDGRAQWAIVHGVAKSQTWLSD